MSEDLSQGPTEIETLLGERQRLQEWLSRLDGATDAPVRVRQRVRADYEGRLSEVVARLRGFSATLSASLTEVQGRLGEVQGQKTELEEERAEAALRHAVGEYSDVDWTGIDAECRTKLGGLEREIDSLSGEIERLQDVLAQIAPPSPRAARVTALDVEVMEPQPMMLRSQPLDPEDEPVAVHDSDQGSELAAAQENPRGRAVEAPRFTPRSGAEPRARERGRTIRFPQSRPAETPGGVDELTFLKSVALDSEDAEEAQARQRAGAAAKTLKCTDCGAMNRPTEWYCERCGAELAAL